MNDGGDCRTAPATPDVLNIETENTFYNDSKVMAMYSRWLVKLSSIE